MEKTTRKYSTNTYEYYKNIIEIETGWLQFLASFGKIPNTKTFDLEYQLELIKISGSEGLDNLLDFKGDSAFDGISAMKEYIEFCFKGRNLEELIPYINYGISTNELSDFIALMHVRKFVKSISSDLRYIKEVLGKDSNPETRALGVLIDKVTTTYPSIYLKSDVFSESLMEFYVGEVGLQYDKNGSCNAFIYIILMLLDRINSYICYMLPSEYEDEVKNISDYIKAFNDESYLESGINYKVGNLINAFDGIRDNIGLMKKSLTAQALASSEEKKKTLE